MGSANLKSPKKHGLVIDAGAFPPSVQLQHFDSGAWEAFIEDCCRIEAAQGGSYVRVQRLGGAGDAGRDVEARLVDDLLPDQWDLYQAKHYQSPVAPSEFFPELAKFILHLVAGTYPIPRYYKLCAPQNAGPDLHDLIANPANHKKRLLTSWAAGSTGMKNLVTALTPQVKAFVENFDFSRIREVLVRDLIDIHANDRAKHFALFKIEPDRGDDPTVPISPVVKEQRYIAELIKVYAESKGTALTLDDVLSSDIFVEHFEACRAEFYCAEGLRLFSRDIFPDEFKRLLDMVHNGIRSTLKHPRHNTGFDRLDAVMSAVGTVQVTDSKLADRLRGGDLPGACHHLANSGDVKWVK